MTVARRIAGLFSLTVAVLCAVAPAAAAFKYVEVGQTAPQFALETLDGAKLGLEDTVAEAKATAVVFWAAWSPRSKAMLDDLEGLYATHKETGFRVLAVNVEHEEISAADRDLIATTGQGWSFPVLLDQGLSTYYSYGVVATPTLALLDSEGVVRFVRASYSTSAKLEIQEAVEAMLGLAPAGETAAQVPKRSYVPPKKATLHYQKAQVLIQRGRSKRALRDLEMASKLDPNWADPRVLLASIYMQQAAKKPALLEKAEGVLAEAESIQPEHLQTLSLHAEVLTALGRYPEAVERANRALAVEPAFTPALLAKAHSLRAQGELDGARAAVQEAMSLDPRNPAVLREQGEVAAAAGQWQQAAASLRSATEAAINSAGERR